MSSRLPMPPVLHTESGAMRRVGVELEMGGLDIDKLSRLVARHVGGQVESLSHYEHLIHGDPAGPWGVELDFELLKRIGREARDPDSVFADLEDAAEEFLRAGAELVVPMEVVSPPLPMDRLIEVEHLVKRLRKAGAQGTRDELIYAFGMQFNPEIPSADAGTITRYLQAFLCLFDWLKERADVDLTRRITSYVDPFPVKYVEQLIDPDYRPDLHTLIDDYLADNPTRNRALDLLPLFAHLDEPRLRRAVGDRRVKARPTFHYRLPNCEIDRADWGVHLAWCDWIEVERLAADPLRLQEMLAEYADYFNKPIARLLGTWVSRVDEWLLPAGR